ncbi:isopenicillin N synthase-like dioxygenase [Erwinia toletana]|uniref:Isopenicillin N synthase-like dioxygenase n=1 Tax=Winslowiella toletana TaxID=92490 RepID=A0ABS4PED9_9GAMM|nr:2-oxoglutarate and iron-dependent oxygenase domain-containing protein [Winslowiella toletana]MBP2170500.1 isopenicillin N synthase-like dioxygenase [Winslowiella toletana]
MSESIPIIDISPVQESDAGQKKCLSTLRQTAHDVGFFYLTGHGVDSALLNDIKRVTRAFFLLSDEEKLAVSMINSPHFRGYNRAAAELTRGQPDWREQFDIGAERVAVNMSADSPVWHCMHGPNQWPENLPDLKSVTLRYQQAMTVVALKLLRLLALALELPASCFDILYGNQPNEHMKLIRYPGRDCASTSQGVGAHKDSGLLTFIMQDEQPGLQVEISERRWIDVQPIDGLFVVNIGELLELATNGYLRATMHRVVAPPAGAERLSVAWFLGASLDATVPVFPLPEHLRKDCKGVDTDPQNPLLRDAGINYIKGRFRSHPDVACKFYRKWMCENG